ncbi:MAG: hypothetical protein NC340_07905 [Ruminococcus flavefaciens]|nr:hypothetical protein [Ruminococcus flavefaciens]MCM1228662.1 hypothetical protein [Ruminococcus flavefaciens]
MSKRKHGHRKKLTAEEKERRRQLAENRKERQKREKEQMILKFTAVAIIGIIFLAVIILSVIFKPELLLIFFIVISALAIILFDQSGIRDFLFRWYPDSFIFADDLKSHDPARAVPMQMASTIGWAMFMLMLFIHNRIFAIIWLICVGVGLYYMFTREEYSYDGEYEGSVLFILITPMFLFLRELYNVRITPAFIAFTVIFTVVYSIAYAVRVHNGNHSYKRIILGIITVVLCSSTSFLLINRAFDFSEPHEYRLTVEDKDCFSGKSTTYYIYTQDWRNPSELIDIRVDYDIYPLLEKGDAVIIEAYSGSLGMEYYEYKEKALS